MVGSVLGARLCAIAIAFVFDKMPHQSSSRVSPLASTSRIASSSQSLMSLAHLCDFNIPNSCESEFVSCNCCGPSCDRIGCCGRRCGRGRCCGLHQACVASSHLTVVSFVFVTSPTFFLVLCSLMVRYSPSIQLQFKFCLLCLCKPASSSSELSSPPSRTATGK